MLSKNHWLILSHVFNLSLYIRQYDLKPFYWNNSIKIKLWFQFEVFFLLRRWKGLTFKTLIFENLRLPLIQFSKFNNFFWVWLFLDKNLPNFEPPVWKLHHLYCHIIQGGNKSLNTQRTAYVLSSRICICNW